MTRPSPIDEVRLRKRPTQARLHLAIFQPTEVLTARVNDSGIAKGGRVITYDGATGDWRLIESGMTIYIGSAPGGKDVGRLRVRSATATQLTLAENDSIDWADDQYLTVVSFFEPWGIFTRIVLDANNVPTFYKDYDVAYTNQNQLFNPILHMGPNYAGFLETGAFGMRFSASGSFDPTDGSFPTGFSWNFDGALTTGTAEPHPGLVQWDTPGCYTVHLTAVTNKGKSSHAHRHIVVMRRPEAGGSPCGLVNEWGISSFQGARRQHGWQVRLWVREESDIDKITDGALVLIISDTRYGDDENLGPDKAIGGNAVARSNLLFAGYIEDESIGYNYLTSKLEFEASSITSIFENKHSFSVSLESAQNAMTWYQIRDMTVDKAVLHYLKWHSTMLDITDFHITDDEKAVQLMDFGRGPIADSVYDLYNSTLFAEVVADRQGGVWSEIQVNLTPTGSRATVPTNMRIAKDDYLETVDIQRTATNPLAYAELGGIGYGGTVTGSIAPYLAGAPGDAPGYEGSVKAISGLVIASQEELNRLTGLYYANDNMRYPEVTMLLAGPYTNIDIAPQEFLEMDLAAEDTWRRLVWIGKRFLPESISMEFDPSNQSLTMSLSMKEETWGSQADTIIIPVEPPYDSIDLPSWDLPTFPVIPFPAIFPAIEPPPTNGDLVYGIFNNRLVRTRNFYSGVPTPTWELVSPSGTFGVGGTVSHMYLDYAAPHQIAYVWEQLTDAGDGRGGPRGRYTNNLDSVSPTWTQFWGLSDTLAFLEPGGGQRQIAYVDQIPELAYHIAWGGNNGGLTSSWFLVGAPFSWSRSAEIVGINPNLQDGGMNAVWRGGGVFGLFNLNTLKYNAAGGLGSWGGSPAIGILINHSPVNFGGGVLWASDEFGPAGTQEMLFDPLGWTPTVTQGRLARVSPSFSGALWATRRIANAGGYHAVNNIRVINGVIHAFMGPSTGGNRTVLLKSSDMASWQIVFDHSEQLGPLEYLKTNTLKMCTYERVGGASSRVLGSQDGGYTWYNKTGNLATLVGDLGTGSLRGGLKFAWTF